MKPIHQITHALRIAGLLLMTTGALEAQTDNKSATRHSGGFGHFAGSYETVNFRSLNSSLDGAGYGQLPSSLLSFGGAGYFVIKNILSGGGGASFMGQSTTGDSTVINMSGGYGFLSVGYLFSTGKRSFFYPNIGLGAGGFTMQLGKKNATADFPQQLSTPRGRFHTGAGGYFFNFQLAWQTMLGTGTKQGWSVGIKAGYKLSPSDWTMDVNGEKATGSPGINMSGYYLTLTIGGGTVGGGR